jgi:16S rRNA (guanine527-N7)-methyltransferase
MNPHTAQYIVNKSVTLNPALPSEALLAYLRDLLRWNPQLGLVSRRDPLAACERLVLESVELLTLVRAAGVDTPARCVDVGSGGGFPGLVWALAEPAWTFLLVERKTARAAFLQAEVLRLSLAHVEVFVGSIEEAARTPRFESAFTVSAAVAVGAPEVVGTAVEPLLGARALFTSTVPGEADPPARIGNALALERRSKGEYGSYAFYRSSG